ncbi:MAG: NAD-dependent epimerase/dehydratase family protein [Candidatus Marinimicrobia bacterium]|nr:NAD-dependent epimerase/dehydratase family protein [Candidatus Neomarinimicrobiota bacterium]
MDRKRIFISGGAGVIGREMVKRYIKKGDTVMVGDLLPIPNEFSQGVLYRQGDLNYITQQELDSFNPEVFVHLAATFERSDETYEHWEENFLHNIKLSNHLMTLMRNVPALKRVVFASSYLIYNKDLYNFTEPQQIPIRLKEEDEIIPRNLTGMAKLAHEIELEFLSKFKLDKFTSISARIFRGYGKGSKDVISRWIRDAISGGPITVYNHEGIFDYIYAGDTAEGLIRLSQINETGAVNLGTGRSRSVEDIVSILKQCFPELKIKYSDSDSLFESSEAHIEKLKTLIDWSPKFDLEETIQILIDYEKKYNNSLIKHSNVLITSISKKIPLINAVKKAVNKINKSIKVFGGDSNNLCIGKYFIDEFWEMPKIDELPVEALINFCKENDIGLIIPSRDGELEYFSSVKNQLQQEGIYVKISGKERTLLCLDKLHFSQVKRIHAIQTSESIDHINSSRYVVKERFGAGSEKIGINLDKKNALAHGVNLQNPIYQPFIAGYEISVDAYVSVEGNVKGIVMRKRDTVINGESQVTSSFRDEKMEGEFKRILDALNLYGHVILQAIISDNGELFVVECNPRFGGASTLSVHIGLDSFYWAYLESMKVSIDDYPFIRSQKEAKQVRYPHDFYI